LQVGLGFLKCLDEDENQKYPLIGITIKHVQEAVDYLDDLELNETPASCPECGGEACVVEDIGKSLYHVGCRQAFVSRAEGDVRCESHPSVMCMPSKRDAVARYNSWVADMASREKEKEEQS
jgi:hypothetical protein